MGKIAITDAELKRIKEAFKRVSSINGCITKQSFFKDVLGEGVPTQVAEVYPEQCSVSPERRIVYIQVTEMGVMYLLVTNVIC
uniref:USP32 N-terminal domain-containing protein n=1 Tax=Timema douglasi TaxID=61478 RepID=A0A7R8VTL6_TIMDO|nr:unnamed protein product [Timema douglasi]